MKCHCRWLHSKSFKVFTYNEAFADCGVHKWKRSGWYIKKVNAKLEVKNKTRLAKHQKELFAQKEVRTLLTLHIIIKFPSERLVIINIGKNEFKMLN